MTTRNTPLHLLPLLTVVALANAGCDLDDELERELALDADALDELDDDPPTQHGLGPDSLAPAPSPETRTVATAATVIDAPREGRLDFGEWPETGELCVPFELANPFGVSLDQVHIQVAIDHAESAQVNRDSTTVWVEDLRTDGARVCVRETAVDQFDDWHEDGLSVAYRMFKTSTITNHANYALTGRSVGSETMDSSSNLCTAIAFADVDPNVEFSGPPIVEATITHEGDVSRNASSVWVKDVDEEGFTACIRERVHGGNMGHYGYAIDWLAFAQGAEPFAGESGQQTMPSQRCTWVEFSESYEEKPLIFATIDRAGSSSNNAGTVWIEDVTLDDPNENPGFELCVHGMAKIGDTSQALWLDKANMSVHWIAKSQD